MSIDCREVLEQIELYLDGELDPAMSAEVRTHLGLCVECMDHSQFQQHLRELLKAKCGCGEVPPQVLEKIRGIFGEHP